MRDDGYGYKYDLFTAYGIMKSVLCGYDPPRSTCSGDSGGPFVCNEVGKAVVYGVITDIFNSKNSIEIISKYIVLK